MAVSIKTVAAACCLAGIFAAGFLARGLFARGALEIVPAASAQVTKAPPAAARRCSVHTLKGSYGIKFDGQKIGAGPFASVSLVTFDGEGTYTTSEIGRFNGAPVQRTFTGPYTVREDCTGFLDFSSNLTNPPHEAHGDFVIVDGGQEFFVVDSEDGWVADGVGKKL